MSANTKICTSCHQEKALEEFRKWRRICRACDREQRRKYSAGYYKKHKNDPEFKKKQRARFLKEKTENRSAYLEKKKRTYARNKEWYNSNWHARRAIAAGCTIVDRTITISKLLQRDKYICTICNTAISEEWATRSAMPSIDHIIPLHLGGQHSWDNVRAVHLGCNNSKADRKDGEFVPNPSFLKEG